MRIIYSTFPCSWLQFPVGNVGNGEACYVPVTMFILFTQITGYTSYNATKFNLRSNTG